MPHCIRIHRPGGPEVLEWQSADLAAPARGEVRVRHKAIGINYIDIYHRTGLYPLELPVTPGLEAAGIVEAVGPDVSELKTGDRVGYCLGPIGAYSEIRNIPAEKVVKLPAGISDETAAAVLLKGMTVEYLFHRTFPLQKGQTILFHAAAGGVGLLAVQWAKHLGCTVIGTAGSKEKAALAESRGCDHVILYREEDTAKRVMDLTGGQGVPVVYDGVGKDTFQASLDSLAMRGMFVSFGQASGMIPDINLKVFAPKSLYYTRPTLFNYNRTRGELLASAEKLFEVIERGAVQVEISRTYPLKDAARAHRDLEARKITGSALLIP